MTPLKFGSPLWLRIASLILLVIWFYWIFDRYSFDSTITVVIMIPLAAWMAYLGIVQIVFLVKGNPPVVEVHDDVVVTRSAFRENVFRRTELQVRRSTTGPWNSLVLTDGDQKASIVNSPDISTKKFNAVSEALLPA